MSAVCVTDRDLVVPNLEHSVLRCLMADTFCSVCTVDWFGVMSVDMVVLVQRRHDGMGFYLCALRISTNLRDFDYWYLARFTTSYLYLIT